MSMNRPLRGARSFDRPFESLAVALLFALAAGGCAQPAPEPMSDLAAAPCDGSGCGGGCQTNSDCTSPLNLCDVATGKCGGTAAN